MSGKIKTKNIRSERNVCGAKVKVANLQHLICKRIWDLNSKNVYYVKSETAKF